MACIDEIVRRVRILKNIAEQNLKQSDLRDILVALEASE
jgi:hypothetical protein